MAKHLLLALAAGSVIGIERSLHGRPAGFRTHALVCLASSLLMLLPVLEARWVPQGAGDSVRLDPTRMAQGIMTGIGFLGAGVIFKDGLTVRGLTTAASIWITAAIGVMIGSGLYYPAGIATVLTLGAHMCKWPIGDPSSDGFTFCGRRQSEGPYCAEHARVAYQPAQAKKRSSASELARSLRRYI